MHIPDGYLSAGACAAFATASIPAVAYAAYRFAKAKDRPSAQAVVGAAGAVLIAHFRDFTAARSVSPHLLGAAALTLLLGPWAATLSLTCTLSLQALVLGDGGVAALGANVFNMAIAAPWAAALAWKFLGAGKDATTPPDAELSPLSYGGVLAAGVFSWVAAAAFASIQMHLSGAAIPGDWDFNYPAVTHGFLAVVEALLTAVIVLPAFATIKAVGRLAGGK